MEVAGLVLGVVGVFDACVAALETIDTFRTFGEDFLSFKLQFHRNRLTLKIWGSSVGFENSKLNDTHHRLLDDEEILRAVGETLEHLRRVIEDCGHISDKFRAPSLLKRVEWVGRSKRKGESLNKQLDDTVNQLLRLIPTEDPKENTKQLQSLLSDDSLKRDETIESVRRELAELSNFVLQQKRDRVILWLGGVLTQNTHEDALRTRLGSTCEWITERPIFRKWRDSSGPSARLLWVNGPAGFGKTVLTSHIIKHLEDHLSKKIYYFYCLSESATRRDPEAILRSWVTQFAIPNDDVVNEISLLMDKSGQKTATRSDLWQAFQISCASVPQSVFVIDGYDECTTTDAGSKYSTRKVQTSFLEELMKSVRNSDCHILIVSRDEEQIRAAFPRTSLQQGLIFSEYSISIVDVGLDVQCFSEHIMNERLNSVSEDLRLTLARLAAVKSAGMFLWVKLLQEDLRDWQSEEQLLRTVTETPALLFEAYRKYVDNIEKLVPSDKLRAIHILRWILFAKEPMTVYQLSEAVAIEMSRSRGVYPKQDLPARWTSDYVQDRILKPCSSLVETRSQSTEQSVADETVHFRHSSIKDFLLSEILSENHYSEQFYFHDKILQNERLTRTCLEYICLGQFSGVGSSSNDELLQTVKKFPFLRYASRHWHLHACTQMNNQTFAILMDRLFSLKDSFWKIGLRIWAGEENVFTLERANPLHYASFFGILKVMEDLHKAGIGVNDAVFDGHLLGGCGSALQAAVIGGQAEAVELLMRLGAELNTQVGEFGDALKVAVAFGYLEIIKMLVGAGADITSLDEKGRCARYLAAHHGRIEALRYILDEEEGLLIDKETKLSPEFRAEFGSETSTQVAPPSTFLSLHTASLRGNKEVAELLLDRGANINIKNATGEAAIHQAAAGGHFATAELLIHKGADVNSMSTDGQTPLWIAAGYGRGDIVQMLLDNGADVHLGRSALCQAAYSGHNDIVKLLLTAGSDVSDAYEKMPALQFAATDGHSEVVKTLLNHGVDINSTDADGVTALYAATYAGHEAVVQLLLASGANFEIRNRKGYNALDAAVNKGHLRLVEQFVARMAVTLQEVIRSRSADIVPADEAAEASGMTLNPFIIYAADGGSVPVLELLLANGEDANACSKSGDSALRVAVSKGHVDFAKALLRAGAIIDVCDEYGNSALYVAAGLGNDKMVEALLNEGANIHLLKKSNGRSALHAAAENGHGAISKMLIESGANVDVRDNLGCTPMNRACRFGHEEVVKTLISAGACIESLDDEKNSALILAAAYGDTSLVDTLLAHGANVEAVQETGFSSLLMAAKKGHLTVLEKLLAKGAKDSPTSNEWTALHSAALSGNFEVAKLLIEHNEFISHADIDGNTPAILAAVKGSIPILQCLLEHGASICVSNKSGTTPLIYAASSGHSDVVEWLLNNGADIDAVDDICCTSLHSAARNGHVEVAEILLARGIDMGIATRSGRKPLHFAAFNNHQAVCELLISWGADIEAKDEINSTAVHLAAKNGHIGIIESFLASRTLPRKTRITSLPSKAASTTLNSDGDRDFQSWEKSLLQAQNSNGWAPLHNAVSKGQEEMARWLLHKGVDVNMQTANGCTPLFIACQDGTSAPALVRTLLEYNADPRIPTQLGETPLQAAAAFSHCKSAVEMLIQAGADVNAESGDEGNLLYSMSCLGYADIAAVLLQNGADTSFRKSNGTNALFAAADNGHLEVVKLLLESGSDVLVTGAGQLTALHIAALRGYEMVALTLVENKADVDALDEDDCTAVDVAIEEGFTSIVKALLGKGAKQSLQQADFNIIKASNRGQHDLLQLLLENGGNANATEDDGVRSLHFAAQNGDAITGALLLKYGASVDERTDQDNLSPLHTASENGSSSFVELLLDAGADIEAQAYGIGWTPLMDAAQFGNADVVTLLLHRGANIEKASEYLRTPLHIAAAHGRKEVVEILLKEGADVKAKTNEGLQAWQLATTNKHVEVAAMLLEAEGVELQGHMVPTEAVIGQDSPS